MQLLGHDSEVKRNFFHHSCQITEFSSILWMPFPCSVDLILANPGFDYFLDAELRHTNFFEILPSTVSTDLYLIEIRFFLLHDDNFFNRNSKKCKTFSWSTCSTELLHYLSTNLLLTCSKFRKWFGELDQIINHRTKNLASFFVDTHMLYDFI